MSLLAGDRGKLPELVVRTQRQFTPARISSSKMAAKFMLSLRDESYRTLMFEAKHRGISVQELIRAVIIPDWVKVNIQNGHE